MSSSCISAPMSVCLRCQTLHVTGEIKNETIQKLTKDVETLKLEMEELREMITWHPDNSETMKHMSEHFYSLSSKDRVQFEDIDGNSDEVSMTPEETSKLLKLPFGITDEKPPW